jgi:NAD(P)-dependent dehydrogenase (short-subunit alcohol dehydrogenase family)
VRRAADGDSLCAENPAILPVRLDVTSPAQIAAAMAMIEARAGALTALVNNAGISVPAPLEILPLDEFRRQIEVNVTGVLAVTQAALPLLRRADGMRTIVPEWRACPRR